MFEQVTNKILALKKVAGIELTFLSENTYVINCIILEVKKEKVIVTETYYNIKSIHELSKKIPELTPVALVLNGKGLIHKKTTAIGNSLSSDILPGVNPNDFLFQYTNGLPSIEVSIIRKAVADKIITALNELKIYTCSLSLAFYDIAYITELIEHNGTISTTQYNLDFYNKKIQAYQTSNIEEKDLLVKPEINIATEYIKSNFLIAYAAAIKLLSQGLKSVDSVNLKSIAYNQNKLQETTLLKLYAFSFLGGILVLLLINFFVYSHYYSENNELLSSYQFSIQQGVKYDTLKKNITDKKQFLGAAGWLNDSKMISFYADRIAATVPESVTLINLNIYPAISKFTLGSKQWSFQQDAILITGKCDDPSLLDNWVKEMGTIKNVSQSKINSYIFKKQGETGIFIAEILIK
jgi:hypothetical protein